MKMIRLTQREQALLLANEFNDHESWSDIAEKVRNATDDEKRATDLQRGDIIANVGIVDVKTRNGVFIVCAVRGTVWSTASGKGDVVVRDLAFHETDTVVLDGVRD